MSFNNKVLGFAAYSGTGKTTLLTKIIPMLVKKGVRVGVIVLKQNNQGRQIYRELKETQSLDGCWI